MRRHWSYLKYVLRHKWYVFLALWAYTCDIWVFTPDLAITLIWRGIWHDWDKFMPGEWFPYARYFYNPDGTQAHRRDKTGYYKAAETGNDAFDMAWLYHQKRNDHHWQWWILPLDDGGIKTLNMSPVALIEMLCDWRGAGQAQGFPNTWEWYMKNHAKMQLHPETREWIEEELAKQAYYQGGKQAQLAFWDALKTQETNDAKQGLRAGNPA